MVCTGTLLVSACIGDNFPDFYLVNTCDVPIEAASVAFSDSFTVMPHDTLHLAVGTEGERLSFELSVNGAVYDSVTGVSPLRITSCPPR